MMSAAASRGSTVGERLSQILADRAETIFWRTDAGNAFTYLHQRTSLTAAQLREFTMHSWLGVLHPEDRLETARLMQQALEARAAFKFRYRLVRSDGSTRWVLSTAEPGFTASGEFEGFVGSVADIGKQELEFIATPQEAAHRLIAQYSGDLISHHARYTGNYLFVSPSVKGALGYEPSELLGRSVYDFIHPEDVALIRNEVARQWRGLPAQVVEHRMRSKDGSEIWISANITLLIDAVSRKELGAISVGRDITKERKAREELRQSEARFRSLTDLSSDWYWETDVEGRFTYLSDGLYRLFRISPEEVLGQTRFERAADQSQPGVAEYETKVARREPFKDIIYSVYVAAHGVVRHSAISGQPVFADDEFKGYRGVGRDITHEIEFAQRLEQLANHDSLTGLPNRGYLQRQLDRLLSSADHAGLAVLFIDLDRFKEVNDSMGHVPGDLLLCEVANRLRASIQGRNGLIARLGGDEFVICMPCADGKKEAAQVAANVLASLEPPVKILGREVLVRASIGISLTPRDGTTREVLFQNADLAMYSAKAAGRNGYHFFEPPMAAHARVRMILENSMHTALERNEFELYYQPQVDLKTMAPVGMEALIRWNHPELGRVSPGEFIPFAEERGYIEAIGKWVLETACRQAAEISRKLGFPLKVSVNLSARQLKSDALVMCVAHALEAAALPADRLELELTETALIENIQASAKALTTLQQTGVSLAIDDFGTGYSGMGYLTQFPINTLKLDRSYVAQESPKAQRVISALIEMAHSLDLSVVAEGVETPETLAALQRAGCDEAQGYFLAYPVPINALEDCLLKIAQGRA
jgi:diguanylate cyclase (GGDEF)-like protein/PAS domain S-box-containing protein